MFIVMVDDALKSLYSTKQQCEWAKYDYIKQHGYIWVVEKRHKWVHAIWFHLHKVQRQAKLIYSIKNQIVSSFGSG